MVEEQILARGIQDPRVLEVMRQVPRERFLPPDQREFAYEDRPLPIGCEATISQPYIVAYMSEKLGLLGPERVLEIGTGSGYQTAVLARLAREVFTIELEEDLAIGAGITLRELGLGNVHLRVGDGLVGWPEMAPFDRIVLTCAVEELPQGLLDQVRVGGWLLAPVGPILRQTLWQVVRLPSGLQTSEWIPVTFVPARRKQHN